MCQTGMASGNLADRHSTVPLTGTHTRPRSAPCQPCKGIVAVHHGHHHTQRPRPPPNRVPPCAPDPSTRCHRVCACVEANDGHIALCTGLRHASLDRSITSDARPRGGLRQGWACTGYTCV